jgi:hypothetical protein
MQMEAEFGEKFVSEIDLLASGPVIHTFEGVVNATPKEIKINRSTGECYFTGVWKNSFQGEQFLFHHHPEGKAVCQQLTGYASGWCTAFFGKPILAIEPLCIGKGDPVCEWFLQPVDKWVGNEEAAPFVKIVNELYNQTYNK